MFKYRITLFESERGWGQNTWTEDYDTPEEAQARIEAVNAQNTSPIAPDYYVMAYRNIEAVRV